MSLHATTTRELAACRGLQADNLFVMPCTDLPMARRAATHMVQRAGCPCDVLLVEDQDRWGFVRITNAAFALTAGQHYGYVAQDAYAGRDWLALALAALQGGKHLFGFNDGKWQGALASFGLARRSWAQANYGGDFFHAGYRRHYADAELTLLAMGQGAYAHNPHSVLIEVDWAKDQAPVDAQDRALYRQRAAAGFEGRVRQRALQTLFH